MSEVLNGTRAASLSSGVPPLPPGPARTVIGDPAARPIRSRSWSWRPRARARSPAAGAWRPYRPYVQAARPTQWISSTQRLSRRVGRTQSWAPRANTGFDSQERPYQARAFRSRIVAPLQRATYRSRVFLRSRRLGGSRFGHRHRNEYIPRGILETAFSRLHIPRLQIEEELESSDNGVYICSGRPYESRRDFDSLWTSLPSLRGGFSSYFPNISTSPCLDESPASSDTIPSLPENDTGSRDSPVRHRILPISSSETFPQPFCRIPLGRSVRPSFIHHIFGNKCTEAVNMSLPEDPSEGGCALSSNAASVGSAEKNYVSTNHNSYNCENDSKLSPDTSSNDVPSLCEFNDTDSSSILRLLDSDSNEWDDEILNLQNTDAAISLLSSEESTQSISAGLLSVETNIEFYNSPTNSVVGDTNKSGVLNNVAIVDSVVHIPTSGPGTWFAHAVPSYKISRMCSQEMILSRATQLANGSWELQSSFTSRSHNTLNVLPAHNTSHHDDLCPLCEIEKKPSLENAIQSCHSSISNSVANSIYCSTQECQHLFDVPPLSLASENPNSASVISGTGDFDFDADLLSWPPYLRDMAYDLSLDPSDFNWDDVNIDSLDTFPDINSNDAQTR